MTERLLSEVRAAAAEDSLAEALTGLHRVARALGIPDAEPQSITAVADLILAKLENRPARLAVWDGFTDPADAIAIDLAPGERLVFSDDYYAVALRTTDPPTRDREVRRATHPDAWPGLGYDQDEP